MPMLPRAPTFAELAEEAIGGDVDAAFELATRVPDRGFQPWFKRWVPPDSRTVDVLDTFADAYALMKLDKQASKKGA